MKCEIYKTYTSGKRVFTMHVKTSFLRNAINVIYGASGSGKTSLLRLLSGLDTLDEGWIEAEDVFWTHTAKNIQMSKAKRNIAFVFQDYGLFPNMTVMDNLKFVKKNIDPTLLQEVIARLEIKHLLMTKPLELSGGQKQRVALARALMQQPKYLFLDEPLTAIDEVLRTKLQSYLIDLQRKYKFTVIMVSHNLQEVLKIADFVCVMNHGEVIDSGKPTQLLTPNPKNQLKGTVLQIENNLITVLIGTQQIKVKSQQIATNAYEVGDVVAVKII